MKRILYLALLTTVLLSCKQSWDGRYTVTAFNNSFGSDSMDTYLKTKLIGRKFDITFDSTQAVVLSAATHNQFKIPRWKQAAITTYFTQFTSSGCRYTIILKRDTGLRMRLQLSVPYNVAIPLPIQNSISSVDLLNHIPAHTGSVECFLTKD